MTGMMTMTTILKTMMIILMMTMIMKPGEQVAEGHQEVEEAVVVAEVHQAVVVRQEEAQAEVQVRQEEVPVLREEDLQRCLRKKELA